jgi:phage tail P2-like protein
VTYPSLLPPASTKFEKALEQAAAALLDFRAPVREVWSPAECPTGHLPWLAWGLAISHWKTGWTVERKREAVADAIPYHRRKGTRQAVAEILTEHHPAFHIVEWHEANPRLTPHTFEVRAPAAQIPASFLTIAKTEEIIADVAIAKPARAHFDFVQNLDLAAGMYLAAGSFVGSVGREDYTAGLDESRDWLALLQTEDGEPILNGNSDSDFLETY